MVGDDTMLVAESAGHCNGQDGGQESPRKKRLSGQAYMNKAVRNVDDNLIKKMTAWEVKMQKQRDDMERRWTDKFYNKVSGSSDEVISMAEHRIQNNIEARVTKMWEKGWGRKTKLCIRRLKH